MIIDNIDISKTLSREEFTLFHSLGEIKLQNGHPLGVSKRMGIFGPFRYMYNDVKDKAIPECPTCWLLFFLA